MYYGLECNFLDITVAMMERDQALFTVSQILVISSCQRTCFSPMCPFQNLNTLLYR